MPEGGRQGAKSLSESRAAGQTSLPAPAGLEELDGTLQLPQQPGGVGTPGGLLELWAPRRGLLVLFKLRGEQLEGLSGRCGVWGLLGLPPPGQLSPVIGVR